MQSAGLGQMYQQSTIITCPVAPCTWFEAAVCLAALYAATKTLIDTYAQMLDAGKVTDLEQLLTFDQFNALVGMEDKLQYEEKYGRGEGQEKLHVKVPGLSRPI